MSRRRTLVAVGVAGATALLLTTAIVLRPGPPDRAGAPPPATTSASPAPASPPEDDVTTPTPDGLVAAHDLVFMLDYGQFSISTGYDERVDYSGVVDRAIEGDGVAQEGPLTTVLSPHQINFEMPLRVEVWSTPPPDDLAQWSEAFEFVIDVGEEGLHLESPTLGGQTVPVPPGRYRTLVTGRGFVAHGWPGSTTPGDDWRIQLWPSDEKIVAHRLRAWTP